jgi:hypothetical protein
VKFTEFVGKLENVRPSGNGRSARCPAHNDGQSSLSISSGGDRILIKCFAGCTVDSICGALNINVADLFYADGWQKPDAAETRFEVRGLDGKLVAVHVRRDGINAVTGQTTKLMWWETVDGRKGLGGIKVKSLPLFGAHLMHEWPKEVIVVAEGEKAALSLRKREVKAVGTVSGAATTPNDDVLRPLLRFGTIVLWPTRTGQGAPTWIQSRRL